MSDQNELLRVITNHIQAASCDGLENGEKWGDDEGNPLQCRETDEAKDNWCLVCLVRESHASCKAGLPPDEYRDAWQEAMDNFAGDPRKWTTSKDKQIAELGLGRMFAGPPGAPDCPQIDPKPLPPRRPSDD